MRSAGSMKNANEPKAVPAASLGDDLKSYKIEHYAGESRPDMLSPGQDYIGFYRFVTPQRVLFISAVHHAERSDGKIVRIHVDIGKFGGRGEFTYLKAQSDDFNAAEQHVISDILKTAFKHDRELLFPLHDRKARRDDEIEVTSFYDRHSP
jgi:hypothetical protein